MAFVQFQAKRFLAPGYSVDDEVELLFGTQDLDSDFEIFGEEHITYNRTRYVRNHGEEIRHSIKTIPIIGALNNQMMNMFIYSCYRTQVFTIDLYNNSLVSSINGYIAKKPSTPIRIAKNTFIYDFDFLEVL